MEKANREGIRRRLPIVLVGLGFIVLAAVLGYLFWGRPAASSYVQVQRGRIRGTVLATGEVTSARHARLLSLVAGRVSTVPVEVGSEVISGTVLVTVEAEALDYRLEEAGLRVEIARLRLAQAQEGATPEEIAAAQADLDLANARLATLEAGPQGEEIAIARQDVVQAEAALAQAQGATAVAVETARLSWETAANALRDAQGAYSRIYWENERVRQRGIEPSQAQQDAEASAWRRVEDAEAAMEQARLVYEQALADQGAAVTTAQARLSQARSRLRALLSGPAEADLAQAQAQVARAQAQLALQQADLSPTAIKILEQELRLAELGLQEAQTDLDKATVKAPFRGTVVEVLAREGEYVGVGVPLVRLADMEQLEIEARIDEIDVGQVASGQAVTITLDAFPGQPLRGYVQEVAPAVSVERGSAVYLSTIVLASPPALSGIEGLTLTLRLGMAASLTIVTVEREDALLVPRRAVERVGTGYYATVLRGGRHERVRVTLGIGDPQYYEVLSGLSEGEEVLVP